MARATASTMGGRQSSRMGSGVWLTPRWILDALGEFALDPCPAPDPSAWPTARTHYAPPRDGLAEPWQGRVWLNPPYNKQARVWIARMAEHGIGTALLFGRTDPDWFQTNVLSHPNATGIFFLAGRVRFVRPDTYETARDNGGAPSVLVAYGPRDAQILEGCGLPGAYWPAPGRPLAKLSGPRELHTTTRPRTGSSGRDALGPIDAAALLAAVRNQEGDTVRAPR
jgi:hypothetical protein